jgi:hypothetical protein
VLVAVAAGLAATATGAVDAGAPQWQRVPNGAIDHRAIAVAAGRFWIVDGPPSGGPVVARSARVTAGGLTAWTATRLAAADAWDYIATLGDDLVWVTGRDPATRLDTLRATRMRAGGSLGPASPVAGGPPPSGHGSRVVRLRDRVLQPADPNLRTDLHEVGLCCDASGKVADYSKLIRAIPLGQPPLLGVDRRGRLWMAWYYQGGQQPDTSWMLELDPETLAPVGGPQQVPSLRFAHLADMICAAVCRLVLVGAAQTRSNDARIFSWAPGEGSATSIRTPIQRGALVGAHDDNGRLVVAYTAQDAKQRLVLALARGDARGRSLRQGPVLPVPEYLGTFGKGLNRTVGPMGVFAGGRFGAFTVYEGKSKHEVHAVVLRLRF